MTGQFIQSHPFRFPLLALVLLALAAGETAAVPDGEGVAGPAAGQDAKVEGLGLELIWVPPGRFQMGTYDGFEYAKPVRSVLLGTGFWLGKYEVTQAEYEAVMGDNPSQFRGDRNPVETVSWNDAVEFCRKLTERERTAGRLPEGYEYRLPTEAEWEYAARGGGKSREFLCAGSDNVDEVAWHDKNSDGKTRPVGRKKPNALGLHDMSGNVWEWCHDWYQNSYGELPAADPAGPENGTRRVQRGGSWSNRSESCHIAFRYRWSPLGRANNLGFRVALAPPIE